MKNSPPPRGSHRKQGAALILVLCFVVLITGLVVAYFSRTLTTRQLSNASTSTTQAEILANSATDIILSDLKQEIAFGSIAATPPPAPAVIPSTGYVATTVYAPTQAANAVPRRNLSPHARACDLECSPSRAHPQPRSPQLAGRCDFWQPELCPGPCAHQPRIRARQR